MRHGRQAYPDRVRSMKVFFARVRSRTPYLVAPDGRVRPDCAYPSRISKEVCDTHPQYVWKVTSNIIHSMYALALKPPPNTHTHVFAHCLQNRGYLLKDIIIHTRARHWSFAAWQMVLTHSDVRFLFISGFFQGYIFWIYRYTYPSQRKFLDMHTDRRWWAKNWQY